ncbi:hypothetical protein QQF64_034580, partial [Cirrhinus molitorella]
MDIKLETSSTPIKGLINTEVCKLLEIKRSLCAPYHPQTNGLVERLNATILESGKFDPEVYIRGPTKAIPTQDVRADAVGHWPQIDSVRQRCKFPKCTGHTSFKCTKCEVHKNKNCFCAFPECVR